MKIPCEFLKIRDCFTKYHILLQIVLETQHYEATKIGHLFILREKIFQENRLTRKYHDPPKSITLHRHFVGISSQNRQYCRRIWTQLKSMYCSHKFYHSTAPAAVPFIIIPANVGSDETSRGKIPSNVKFKQALLVLFERSLGHSWQEHFVPLFLFF